MHLSDLTKLAVDVANVDQFYRHMVTCLPFNVSVGAQNLVKIRRYLPELWQRVQGFSFFVDTVYIARRCVRSAKHQQQVHIVAAPRPKYACFRAMKFCTPSLSLSLSLRQSFGYDLLKIGMP